MIVFPNSPLKRYFEKGKLQDLKVLRGSPDLFNNVINRSKSTTAYNKTYFVLPFMGLQPFWSSDLKNLMNTPSNSPVISEKPMF